MVAVAGSSNSKRIYIKVVLLMYIMYVNIERRWVWLVDRGCSKRGSMRRLWRKEGGDTADGWGNLGCVFKNGGGRGENNKQRRRTNEAHGNAKKKQGTNHV